VLFATMNDAVTLDQANQPFRVQR